LERRFKVEMIQKGPSKPGRRWAAGIGKTTALATGCFCSPFSDIRNADDGRHRVLPPENKTSRGTHFIPERHKILNDCLAPLRFLVRSLKLRSSQFG
jgi:hypothetical protein